MLDHNGDNVEVVVCDDGSGDDTRQRIERMADPRVSIIAVDPPGGANRARNLGVHTSHADLIAFLDSDDAFRSGRCERLIGFFREHGEIHCTIDGYVDHWGRRDRTHRLPARTPDASDIHRMLVAHCLPLTNSTLTIRRSAFEEIGGYDEQLMRHQDRELLLRLCKGHRIAFGQAIDVDKYRGSNSISRNHDGYVDGLDDFAARLPESQIPANQDLFRYLAVRSIFKSLLQGRIVCAGREIARLNDAAHLPHGVITSLLRYRTGRNLRDEWWKVELQEVNRT